MAKVRLQQMLKAKKKHLRDAWMHNTSWQKYWNDDNIHYYEGAAKGYRFAAFCGNYTLPLFLLGWSLYQFVYLANTSPKSEPGGWWSGAVLGAAWIITAGVWSSTDDAASYLFKLPWYFLTWRFGQDGKVFREYKRNLLKPDWTLERVDLTSFSLKQDLDETLKELNDHREVCANHIQALAEVRARYVGINRPEFELLIQQIDDLTHDLASKRNRLKRAQTEATNVIASSLQHLGPIRDILQARLDSRRLQEAYGYSMKLDVILPVLEEKVSALDQSISQGGTVLDNLKMEAAAVIESAAESARELATL